MGGDEFVIMLEGIKSRENAENVANRIQNDLKVPFTIEGYEIFVTASIGIAISSVEYGNAEELLRDTDTMQVVASIIELCQKMGKSIVAEGIETRDQLKLLEELRCSFGQGFLFSKPLDEAAITELINDCR
ncbi:MAG TPA: EAL domain-containing protein [Dissulfurispiraceae bacterium]|nr:EAL domain-containing protein [Dissulfurispiraceae bacterium]